MCLCEILKLLWRLIVVKKNSLSLREILDNGFSSFEVESLERNVLEAMDP